MTGFDTTVYTLHFFPFPNTDIACPKKNKKGRGISRALLFPFASCVCPALPANPSVSPIIVGNRFEKIFLFQTNVKASSKLALRYLPDFFDLPSRPIPDAAIAAILVQLFMPRIFKRLRRFVHPPLAACLQCPFSALKFGLIKQVTRSPQIFFTASFRPRSFNRAFR
ncbi:hypothetical protein QWJ34_12095 [Saccharibacillus sp. CPCC 101409]|uniref:hypothetical protein n=1 Tax=Saccharibacillus sp. CPCC 101409 TaxID=3058041 RepID=UPI0026730718|nr:hypothetical protein [Saccharibacillus sp. CPCC 101409]MDO3410503.1 hypothetical protein [Saccharibacillus sp. CPCC 101409]